MTALKAPAPLNQNEVMNLTGGGTFVPLPSNGVSFELYTRTVTAFTGDTFWNMISLGGRIIQVTFTNSANSTAVWNVYCQSASFYTPDAGVSNSVFLNPGESRTFTNTTVGTWNEI